METQNIKSRATLSSFIRYCVTHPEERFWQALRNWSGYNFVCVSDNNIEHEDTFYLQGRRHGEKS